MSRIRTTKPEHWADRKLATISLPAHLMWLGTWNFSDDAGIFENDPLLIKSNIFPRREDVKPGDIKKWLEELVNASFILPFEFAGESFFVTRTFHKHQKIDRPKPSKIPFTIVQRVFDEHSSNDREKAPLYSTVEESNGKGRESKVEETPSGSVAGGPATAESVDLKKIYRKMDKGKKSLCDFIKMHRPEFLEPYYELWKIFSTEKNMPTVKEMTSSRRKKIATRVKEPAFDFLEVLRIAGASEFIRSTSWFSFDWVIENEKNYLKVLEGNYERSGSVGKAPAPVAAPKTASQDISYLVDRYKEGDLDERLLTPQIYSGLVRLKMIPENYLARFPGNNDEQARQAIRTWLQAQVSEESIAIS